MNHSGTTSIATDVTGTAAAPALSIGIDGTAPLSAATVAAVNGLCDLAEDAAASGPVLLRLTGVPTSVGASEPPLALVNKWERALRRLERLNLPVVAVVTGDCGGVALEALLTADYRIAEPGTQLLPPTGPGGVWPGMALYRLTNQLGVAATRRTVLFGAPVPAEQALRWNLLDRLVDAPGPELPDEVTALPAAAGAGLAVRRQLMLDAATTSFEEALGRHLAACDRVLRRTGAGAAS